MVGAKIEMENMLIKKECISITNKHGEIIYGMLTQPTNEKCKKVLVIFFQVGTGTKTGVGDYLRILSDDLAQDGFTVLRFDQSGTGESHGEISSRILISELFRFAQSGFFKDDSLAAIDWAASLFRGYQIFLLGECGGCISAMLACSERIPHISGLIMIAVNGHDKPGQKWEFKSSPLSGLQG